MQVTFVNPSDASNNEIRAEIENAGARVFSVVFIKKDGSIRRMVCQRPAVKTHCVGSELGARMSESFHRNPENAKYVRVFDMQKGAIRSINLDTVLSLKSRGAVIRYRPLHVMRHAMLTAA